MNNDTSIKCPNCKEVFKVDESVYLNIVQQIRDQKFEEELSNRLAISKREKENAVKLTKAELASTYQKQLSEKEKELNDLKLKGKSELANEMAKKDHRISQLQSNLKSAEIQKQLDVSNAVSALEKERNQLQNDLKNKATETALLEKSLTEKFNNQLALKDETIKLKDDEVARLKDYRQRLSTKMIGESLEQHCKNEFDKLRATAFPNAYFEKDNDASQGSKGDYIFKETDAEGNEIVSIMFEMKNENDTTTTKQKNEDFFAKLEKDRNAKKCEYAVLVSLLETDNAFYNTGIADVSYRYPKMYVIRPQFFIPIINFLRNAGMKSLQYKAELNLVRNQNIDITNFEEKINAFKTGFAKNYLSASDHFEKAIAQIDRSIASMQQVKKELTTSANQLRLANNKAEGLTIKKLTYGNPTMKQMFNNAKNQNNLK